MKSQDLSFKAIRQWDGSQHRAFEELCYQLRDRTPEHAKLVKTGDPDGGLEWYVTFRNGVQWGWQAKFTFDIDILLKLLEKSLRTVAKGRPRCHRLTFGAVRLNLVHRQNLQSKMLRLPVHATRPKRWPEAV